MSQRDTSTGKVLEDTIVPALERKGFLFVSETEFKKRPSDFGGEYILKNATYSTIYGHIGRTEYVLHSERKNLIARIECKWQQVAGSVDEKLPYLYLNMIEKMTEPLIIIVYGGGGWKPGAIQWLKDAVAEKKYQGPQFDKDIRIYSIDEFLTWVNATFR